jgi:signal transduction histidine kinase
MALEQLSVEREEHIKALSGMNNQIHDLVSNLKQEIDERTAASQALEAEIAERIRLEREIVKISDNERLQISHDLHDGLCQQLTGARLRCAALESKLTSDGICVEDVPLLGQLLDDAVNHAYDLSRGLWPMDLDSNDLTASLGELIRRISRQDGPTIELFLQRGCAKCPAGNESQIFRIAQEAITNAVKHAKATLVSVSLECSPGGGLVMHVRDNGAGRSRSKNVAGGMGIGIMTHRAKNIGGSLEIQDPEDGGTVVVCTVPCARQLPSEDYRA